MSCRQSAKEQSFKHNIDVRRYPCTAKVSKRCTRLQSGPAALPVRNCTCEPLLWLNLFEPWTKRIATTPKQSPRRFVTEPPNLLPVRNHWSSMKLSQSDTGNNCISCLGTKIGSYVQILSSEFDNVRFGQIHVK